MEEGEGAGAGEFLVGHGDILRGKKLFHVFFSRSEGGGGAEIYCLSHGDWPLDKEVDDLPSSAFWPLATLTFLAQFPHQYKTWLAYGHTVPNGADYAPLDSSVGFGGVVLGWGDGPLGGLTAEDGQRIMLYEMIPCYQEEIEYKLKYGMDELHRLLQEHGALGMLDPKRPNLCPDFHEVLD